MTSRTSICHLILLIGIVSNLHARRIFIPKEATWRYHNGEEAVDPAWKEAAFDDSKWQSGFAPLGYGGYSPNTIVSGTASPRPITTYFRTDFSLEDPEAWDHFEMLLRVDDSAVVYLNGQVMNNYNLPFQDTYAPDQVASTLVRTTHEYIKNRMEASYHKYLVAGKNTIAVEVHQNGPESSDLIFDFSFSGLEKGIEEKQLFAENSEWKYYDERDLAGEDWTGLEFDDSRWKTGRGILGYGDNDINAKVDPGSDPKNKPVTVWFRKTFEIANTMDVQAFRMNVVRDDGIVIYLNGVEVTRDRMPAGFIDSRTLASRAVWKAIERVRHEFHTPAGSAMVGRNVIAVEVHQSQPGSSDLAFDMALSAEYFPGDGTRVVKVAPTSKVVDLSTSESLKKSAADDWLLSSRKFNEEALSFHEAGKLQPAIHSYYASRWSAVFAENDKRLDPALMEYLLKPKQDALSQEFFDLYSSYDNHRKVYEIINRLFTAQPESFRAFPKLAMAIGLVYDQKPPVGWPHHQVPGHVLPRELHDPGEAMKFWVETEQNGKSLIPLAELSIEELKYVVDTPAPFEELKEAQDLRVRLGSIGDLYSGINYVHERLETNTYDWPHESYSLPEIKERGGICVDQAYYTIQVAKAHGVPSMVVSGSGNSGNHAWVGFLDSRGRWDFSVGRYPESKFVTGITFDPQTWQQPTDHDLAQMSERFRTNSKFRISRIHTVFAEEYLARGKTDLAIKTAALAIEAESRNYSAWAIMMRAKKAAKTPVAEMDALYEKGAKAFSRYADLESGFLRRLATSYEEQSRTEEADKLRARIISRNRRERPDLALDEAKVALDESMESSSPEKQVDLYKSQISRLRDAGLIAYYALTNPFLEHLVEEDRKDLAADALKYTKRRMDVEEGSQLESALIDWEKRVGEE